MKHSVKNVKQKGKIIVKADKSDNLYSMDVSNYKKMLFESITSKYKKATNDIVNNINTQAGVIISKNNIKGKMKKIVNSKDFITLKDHKKNFPYKMSCRLINKCKSS